MAKLPASVLHHQEKKMNVMFVMHWVKIYVGSSLFFFYHQMVRTSKMSFYKRKILFEISGTLPTLQKASGSVLKTMCGRLAQTSINSQPATDCGLIEGKPSTDIVVLDRYHLRTPQS